jgi:hypothetical protein
MQGIIADPAASTPCVNFKPARIGASCVLPRGNPVAGLLAVLAGAVLLVLPAAAKPPQIPQPDHHWAEMEYRAMLLRDENGIVAPDGLMNGLVQKQGMSFNPKAWPGTPGAIAGGGFGLERAGINSNIWTALGPGNVGGRVRSILVHPTTPSTMWLGSVGGGVWKTVNGGASWFPLNDFMANLAIGCLVMDPTDTNTIFAGTGEGFSNSDAQRGAGIFKTSDGGMTWSQLASTANSSFYYVNRLAICPTNHLSMLAATGMGIWLSANGGTNWTQRFSTTAMLDIAFNPADGSKAIASGSTFFSTGSAQFSIDGGQTWAMATNLPSAGRIEVAYAASSPNIVYASVNTNGGEVYMSSDGGQNYSRQSTGYNYLSGQGWYDNCIWVDPTNPNLVVIGGTDIWRSTDGGTTFTDIGGYSGSIHPDQHAIVPTSSYNGTTSRTVYIGNDGGVFRATDIVTANSGSGWTTLNNNLVITQFYGAAGNHSSGTIVGGTQDNGTLRYNPSAGWSTMFGGDGGFCAADQTDPNYFYGEYVYLQIHRSTDGGLSSSYITSGLGDAGVPGPGGDPDGEGPNGDPDSSANFIAPFILDPNNANTMLAGGSNLWRSVNVKAGTPTWTNIKPGANGSFISAIACASGNSDIIWVGHSNGDVYSTSNGTAVSPTWTRQDQNSPNLPNRACTRLTIDPTNYNVVYATFGGFSADNIYRTADGGATWTNLAGGLPSVPVHSLVIAPFNRNYLYVGTEIGVFASDDGGATWSPGNEGAANAAAYELFWVNNNLVAATHGRGLFSALVSTVPVINLTSATLASESCPPGNGAIDPGETVTMNFALANISAVATSNLTATLLATNGVVSPGPAQNFGALVAGGGAVSRPFSFTASGVCGGNVTANLQLADGTNNLGTVSTTLALGVPNILLSQKFDGVTPPALPAGWTVSWTGVGAAWVTEGGISDTAPNAAFAPDPDDVSDNNLISPTFTVNTTNAQVTFRHSYGAEFTYDGGALEISTNGGAFADIISAGGSFVTNGYTQTISSDYSNPLAGRRAWSGNSGGFVTTIVTLPAAAAGKSVQLRWRFGSDIGTSSSGWYVDTISVADGFTCCSGVPPLVILSIQPTGNSISLAWSSTAGLTYRLQYKTDLLATNWNDVSGDVLAGSGIVSKVDTNAIDAHRYYRVVQLP